jgi:hypothetical protein
VLKIIVVRRYEWRRCEQEHAHRELLVVDARCHEFIKTNLSASPYLARLYRRLVIKYLK